MPILEGASSACVRLPDPRRYARVDPHQPLLRLLMRCLTAKATEFDTASDLFRKRLTQALEQGEDALIQQAMEGTPDHSAYQAFWQALKEQIDPVASPNGSQARLFALPLLFIVASRQSQRLRTELPDRSALRRLWVQLGLIGAESLFWLSPFLSDLRGLSEIPPSVFFKTTQQLKDTASGLEWAPGAEPILAGQEEAVYLRFWLGYTLEPSERLETPIDHWGLALSHYLKQSWQHEGLSLFVMPRPVGGLWETQSSARFTYQEVAFQLTMSAALRRIRAASGEAVAVLAAHQGNEIRVHLADRQQPALQRNFVWRLAPMDVVETVQDMMVLYLRECKVEDIRCVAEVQDARDSEGLPLFVTATETAPAA